MVPFYGQGLNCGLEDVRVLGCMLQKHNVSSVKSTSSDDDSEEDIALTNALSEYSEVRGDDLEAICQLAMDN
jgi:kynurenine 3-monooxygenase